MKKNYYIYIYLLLLLTAYNSNAQYITLKGNQFYDQNGLPFWPMVMNYDAQLTYQNIAGSNVYKPIRNIKYGTQAFVLEGGYTFANCENSLADDFTKLHQMGFDAVRLLLHPNRKTGSLGFTYTSFEFSNLAGNPATDYIFNFDPDPLLGYNTSQEMTDFFNGVGLALDLAAANNIKVILLCADPSDAATAMGSADIYAADYANYLHKLADILKNKPALLAYDLYNEPQYGTTVQVKEKVCDYVNQWCTAIRTADQNHLITLGAGDMGNVMSWDESIMNIDFGSFHIYQSLPDNYAKATEKVLNELVWLGKSYKRPWIIGETGFSCSPEACINSFAAQGAINGTPADQYNYMAAILPAVRNSGASGFSWWEFQDVHYYCVPQDMCSSCISCDICSLADVPIPSDFDHKNKAGNGNYFGLLQFVDPVNGVYPSSGDKPAVALTSSFNPNVQGQPLQPTAFYFNPNHNPTSGTTLTGTVNDFNTAAVIEGAVVFGNTTVHLDNIANHNIHPLEYTFSDVNGSFTVTPVLSPYTPLPTTIDNILVSAYGAERVLKSPVNGSFNPGNVISLHRSQNDEDDFVINQTVASNNSLLLQGWNTLTATNIEADAPNSSLEMKARNEVHILQDFSAYSGSNVHIHCEPVFEDCSVYNGFTLLRQSSSANSPSKQTESHAGSKEIEVTFQKNAISNSLFVFPNPSKGVFTVELRSEDRNSFIQSVSVYDITGRKIYSVNANSKTFLLDLTYQLQGIYFLEIKDGLHQYNQKIIIQ